MEKSLYEENQDKNLKFIVGLFTTIFLSSLLFVEYWNIDKVAFLVLLIGGLIGLLQVTSVPIKKAAEKGFLWGHYILMSIQLTIIYFSGFDYIFELFVITNTILLFKNLLGLYLYRGNREYF